MTSVPLEVFVDEAGDRGTSAKSSPYFIMGAVTVDSTRRVELANTIADIKRKFGIPLTIALHWSDHCRNFERRQYVSSRLAELTFLQLNYVVIAKRTLPSGSRLGSDSAAFYNYAAGMLLDRVLLGAEHWAGGPQRVRVTFGHVRGMDHSDTRTYFERPIRRGSFADWTLLDGQPRFIDTAQNSGVQAADQFVGMLRHAITEDHFGGYEPHHLLAVRHLIRRGPNNRALGYGLKVMAEEGFPTSLPWWPK